MYFKILTIPDNAGFTAIMSRQLEKAGQIDLKAIEDQSFLEVL
jgi:hypothetical protein